MPGTTPFVIDETTFPPARITTFAKLLNVVLPLLTLGAALLLLVMLLYGSFMWIRSEGNPENVKKAHNIMTYSILGLLLVVLSYILVKLITIIFNIQFPL